jgi:hypothetical protein
MKKVLSVALVVILFASGCATLKAHDPYRNPDGSINVPKVLRDAGFGLQADCLIPGAVAQVVCAIGTPALAAAQAAADKNPQAAAAAAANSLQATIDALPPGPLRQIVPYFMFAIRYLKGLSGA